MKKIIRLCAVVVIIAAVIALFGLSVSAATSGSCGDALTYEIIGDELIISGSGAMWDWDNSTNKAPWGYCSSVKKITIEPGVTTIGNYAFYQIPKLESITIPASITSIGRDIHPSDITSLNAVYISDIAAWCNVDFSRAFRNPLYYAHNLYLNNELVTDVIIPDGVTTLNYTFANCTNLKSAVIPNSVTQIDCAFEGCTNLEEMTLPFVGRSRNATEASMVFGVIFNYDMQYSWNYPSAPTGSIYQYKQYLSDGSYCNYYYYVPSNLKKVTITDTTQIPSNAFYNCSFLTDITIADNVTSIGSAAFYNCGASIHFRGETPPEIRGTYSDIKTAYIPCNASGYDAIQSNFPNAEWETEHDWEWDIIVKPSQTAPGMAKRVCARDASHTELKKLPELTDTSVWTEETIPPTCTRSGSHSYTSEYGTVTDTTTPALGHIWGEWNMTKLPSSSEIGRAERICTADSSHQERVWVPVLTDEPWKCESVPPTCIQDGSKTYTSEYGSITEPWASTGQEHNWGEWVTWVEPTADSPGMEERVCLNDSSHTELKELPAVTIPHISAVVVQTGIDVTAKNLPQECSIILALYRNERLVSAQTAVCSSETLHFDVTEDYDSFKVLAWEGLASITPLCNHYQAKK